MPVGGGLDGDVLAIQGPPGTGKTFTGAELICELVAAGKTVGVTAVSHKVIMNLLEKAAEAASKRSTTLGIVHKPKSTDGAYEGDLEILYEKKDAKILAGKPMAAFGFKAVRHGFGPSRTSPNRSMC